MLELLLINIFLISGVVAGGAMGASVSVLPESVIIFAVVGGFVGVANAYVILSTFKKSEPKQKAAVQRAPTVAKLPVGTQVGFRTRMYNFLKVKESDVPELDNYKSSMPFWSIVDVCWKRTVRTADEIRAVLMRIRERLS
jgi:hypothetical protein